MKQLFPGIGQKATQNSILKEEQRRWASRSLLVYSSNLSVQFQTQQRVGSQAEHERDNRENEMGY